MQNLLFIIVAIVLIGWIVGFIAYGIFGLIYALFFITAVAILIYNLDKSRREKEDY